MPALAPKNQIPISWLEARADIVAKILSPWTRALREEKISEAGFAALSVISWVRLWKGPLWTAGRFSATDPAPRAGARLGDIANDHATLNFGSHADEDLFEFLSRMRLRGVSERAQRALLNWQNGRYKIHLRFDVPEAREILKIQAEGFRLVTVFHEKRDLAHHTLDRDPLEFTLHDLEHADEFFFDENLSRKQIEVYRRLLSAHDHPDFLKRLAADPEFRSDWDYLIGDMNTHPEHMQSSFRAILRLSVKREEKWPYSTPLPPDKEEKIESLFQKIFPHAS